MKPCATPADGGGARLAGKYNTWSNVKALGDDKAGAGCDLRERRHYDRTQKGNPSHKLGWIRYIKFLQKVKANVEVVILSNSRQCIYLIFSAATQPIG